MAGKLAHVESLKSNTGLCTTYLTQKKQTGNLWLTNEDILGDWGETWDQ